MRHSDLDTTRPFTRDLALRHGLDPTGRGNRFQRLFHDVYVDRSVELTPMVRARAALALHLPTAHLSHTTAAEVMGLPVPATDRVHVTAAQQDERRQRPGIACHVQCREITTVQHSSGLTLPSPLDLFIELAGVLSLVDLVVVGDAMARRGLFTAYELRTFCAGTQRWHSRRARRGAAHVRDRVDSPMESRLRLLLSLAGLPEPVVNHLVRTADGERFLDLAYAESMVAIEYDGRHHAEREAQWESDLVRREKLEALGWRFVVVTADGIFKEPDVTLRRVVSALAGRGRRTPPLRDAWRVHFPTR
ncbi:hypothetical protein GCM10027596_22780 [Nocardioides korecus]